jgi:hypothetical protein
MYKTIKPTHYVHNNIALTLVLISIIAFACMLPQEPKAKVVIVEDEIEYIFKKE